MSSALLRSSIGSRRSPTGAHKVRERSTRRVEVARIVQQRVRARERQRRLTGVIEELNIDRPARAPVVLVHEVAVGTLLRSQKRGQLRYERGVSRIELRLRDFGRTRSPPAPSSPRPPRARRRCSGVRRTRPSPRPGGGPPRGGSRSAARDLARARRPARGSTSLLRAAASRNRGGCGSSAHRPGIESGLARRHRGQGIAPQRLRRPDVLVGDRIGADDARP